MKEIDVIKLIKELASYINFHIVDNTETIVPVLQYFILSFRDNVLINEIHVKRDWRDNIEHIYASSNDSEYEIRIFYDDMYVMSQNTVLITGLQVKTYSGRDNKYLNTIMNIIKNKENVNFIYNFTKKGGRWSKLDLGSKNL